MHRVNTQGWAARAALYTKFAQRWRSLTRLGQGLLSPCSHRDRVPPAPQPKIREGSPRETFWSFRSNELYLMDLGSLVGSHFPSSRG